MATTVAGQIIVEGFEGESGTSTVDRLARKFGEARTYQANPGSPATGWNDSTTTRYTGGNSAGAGHGGVLAFKLPFEVPQDDIIFGFAHYHTIVDDPGAPNLNGQHVGFGDSLGTGQGTTPSYWLGGITFVNSYDARIGYEAAYANVTSSELLFSSTFNFIEVRIKKDVNGIIQIWSNGVLGYQNLNIDTTGYWRNANNLTHVFMSLRNWNFSNFGRMDDFYIKDNRDDSGPLGDIRIRGGTVKAGGRGFTSSADLTTAENNVDDVNWAATEYANFNTINQQGQIDSFALAPDDVGVNLANAIGAQITVRARRGNTAQTTPATLNIGQIEDGVENVHLTGISTKTQLGSRKFENPSDNLSIVGTTIQATGAQLLERAVYYELSIDPNDANVQLQANSFTEDAVIDQSPPGNFLVAPQWISPVSLPTEDEQFDSPTIDIYTNVNLNSFDNGTDAVGYPLSILDPSPAVYESGVHSEEKDETYESGVYQSSVYGEIQYIYEPAFGVNIQANSLDSPEVFDNNPASVKDSSAAQPNTEIVNDSPRSYFLLGEDDGDGNIITANVGNNMSWTTGAGYDYVGRQNKKGGFYFGDIGNGTKPSYVAHPEDNIPAELISSSNYSVEIWLKPAANIRSTITIARGFNNANIYRRFQITSGGVAQVYQQSGGVDQINDNIDGLTDGNWHQIVAIFRNGSGGVSLYKDGAHVGTNFGGISFSPVAHNSGELLQATGDQNNTDVYFRDFAVWSRALTAQEVLDHYNASELKP